MSESPAFDAIEKAWTHRLRRWRYYALALTGNWTDAEEVVQEAVARTVQAAPRLPSEQDAHNYILTAVRTAALHLFRQRNRYHLVDRSRLLERVDVESDPLRLLLQDEAVRVEAALTQKALNAMAQLSPEHREAIECLVLREPPMKLRELAAIQHVAVSTAHNRLRMALRRLGEKLGEPRD